MCKLTVSSVICFLLFTAAKASATPVRDTTIPDAHTKIQPAFIHSVTELSALPLESRYPEAVRNDSLAVAGRESALNLPTTDLTGSLRTVHESPAARWGTTFDSVVTLSPALPAISAFDEDANLPISRVGTIAVLNTYRAGFLPPVSEPVSLLLLGSSLLAIAGMIRRATRSAGDSDYESEDSQLPATFPQTNESSFRAPQ